MTAERHQELRTPPRYLIKVFWRLHRAAYRLTRGRFGLAQPEAGERFGFMRLSTTGRRTGKARVAILGYYEDGPNLVTLAMNGWADGEPAWWLNLQAEPDTSVDLADGSRPVRARAATASERERLWAMFRDYPGWGDDIDALAGRRSRATTIVVFEPRSKATPAGRAGVDDLGDTREHAPVAPASTSRRLRPTLRLRHGWVVPALAIAIYANGQAAHHALGLVPLLAFGIAPHLPVLAGWGQPRGPGRLGPRMIALFNALHHPVVPMMVAGLAAAGLLTPFWFVGALAWLSHIVMDWAMGDGLRTAEGSVRPRSIWNGRPFPVRRTPATASARR